jgi:hypothetical protein
MALLGWCLSAARVAGVCLTEASPPAPTSTNRPPRAPFTGGLGNRIVLGNGPDTVVAGAGNDVVSLGRGDDEVTQRAIAGRVGLQMTGRALISLKVNDASAMSASFDPCLPCSLTAQAAILSVLLCAIVLASLFSERRESEERLVRSNIMLQRERKTRDVHLAIAQHF